MSKIEVFNYLLCNILNASLALFFLLFGYFLFSKLTKWRFADVLTRQGSGGSIVVASFLLGLSLVIAAAAF